MKVIGKRGQEITTWEDWERPAKPVEHWVAGRSAMEIARAFFRNGPAALPEPLVALFAKEAALAGFEAVVARPEHQTALPPRGASGPRNHDVWLSGDVAGRPVRIGIEAKADEEFDRPLTAKLAAGEKRIADGLGTDTPERLQILGSMLFGPSFDLGNPDYGRVGYQLVSGLAGTLIEAASEGVSLAAFVVYEFSSSLTSAKKQSENAKTLDAFVRLLPGSSRGPDAGQLVGPIHFDASEPLPRAVDVYIGKVTETIA
jgi:hypothetical protein